MTLALDDTAVPQAASDEDAAGGLVLRRAAVVGIALGVVAAADVLVASGARVPFAGPALGFAAVFGVPLVFVLLLLDRWWFWWHAGERAVVGVAVTALGVMGTGALLDAGLGLVGVDQPLATLPVLVAGNALTVALAVVVHRTTLPTVALPLLPTSGWRARACLAGAAIAAPLAAAGAVRLNNGHGAELTLVALALVLVTFAGLFAWRDLVEARVLPLAIYGLSLALLLMTSLRGWFTTGHDVQHEMLVFLRTLDSGDWSTAAGDAYSACLSLTVLPTVLQRWAGVADPYVFKVFFPMLFAACPVGVYYVGRRIGSEALGIVSVVFFVGFVTFVQDMPMLARQEIAFIFFVAALLVLLMSEQSARHRRIAFCVLAVGMVVSHYSTAFFTIGALGAALVARPLLDRIVPRLRVASDRAVRRRTSALGWPLLAALTVTVVVWQGPVAGNAGQLGDQLASIADGLTGDGARTAEAGAAVPGLGRNVTEDEARAQLFALREAMVEERPEAFLETPPASDELTPPVADERLPASALGQALPGGAETASALHRTWRVGAALGLELLCVLGVAVVVLRRRWGRGVPHDAALLGVGVLAVLAVQVVAPGVSLQYGVARAFLQALMVLGPLLGIGLLAIAVGPLRRHREGLAMAVALVVFASTSGLVPQLLGAYRPQLHLNNSGTYYDRFYLHPEEVAALRWLQGRIDDAPGHPAVQMDVDLFNKARSLGGVQAFDDIYPSALRRDAYLVLGRDNVVDGKFVVPHAGWELWMEYPVDVVDRAKNLVYANGSTRVYR